MLTVGLTGGIGSGKSTVSALFVARGAVLVDADAIARMVVAAGTPGLAAVTAEFGFDILTDTGELDRPALGSIVFSAPERLAALNAIVHPLVAAESHRQRTLARQGSAPVLIHDVPLLVENGLAEDYDEVVVVAASPVTQRDRLVRLRHLSEADAAARIAAQAPLAAKLAVATHVIDNDGPLVDLEPQVVTVWARLLAGAEGR